MRLDKFISDATKHSRSEARKLITSGQVTVNDITTRHPSLPVKQANRITLKGVEVQEKKPLYIMLNKPAGYICAVKDRYHPTVVGLIDIEDKSRLHMAGRLDSDTTGLVLLTDDGQWSHAITSPRRACKKTYQVTTAAPISKDIIDKFRQGILLNGEKQATRPAFLEIIAPREALLTISEGKYHQVKRMFAAMNNRVTSLHREQIGKIKLDPDLEAGQYRALNGEEIGSISP